MWKRIGHRGAAGTRPELTSIGFERAIELGVEMIELDVQLTRDRQLVVLHDLELGRTVAALGRVRDLSLDDLRTLDAGRWFDPAYTGLTVLSLDDVFDLIDGRVALNVEIKSPEVDFEGTAIALVEILERRGAVEPTIVSSFSRGALRAVRRASPTARIGVLWHQPNVHDAFVSAASLDAVAIHPQWRLIDQRLVDGAHKRSLIVNTWTVNDVTEMRRLVALGVDGLISDYPERFDEVLGRN
jgi:glycerophosphoryl diester phosphodiesterase